MPVDYKKLWILLIEKNISKSDYWKSLAEKGKSQNVLSSKDLSIIDNAVKYCEFVYTSLYPKQVKEINIVLNKLKENGIE